MDKETLSHYGWIVILVLILAVLLALASPFGTFIAGAIKSTTAGIFNVNQAALGSAGINVDNIIFPGCEHNYVPDTIVDCNTTGTITYTCEYCGDTYTEIRENPQHVFDNADDLECNECGKKVVEYSFRASDYDAKMGTTTATDEYVVIPATFEYNNITYKVTSIGGSAFANCTNLKTVIIPYGVKRIDGFAFQRCTSLSKVILPESLPGITGQSAFAYCSSLTSIGPVGSGASIEIPNTLTEFGYRPFHDCNGLISVVTPDNVTKFGTNVFSDCKSLSYVRLPNTITKISDCMFTGCDSIKSIGPAGSGANIEIPESVTTLGHSVFGACEYLISIEIPSYITDLGTSSFHKAHSLKSMVVPSNITRLTNATFEKCRAMTTITIPASVTAIDSNVFSCCDSLRTINFTGTIEQWNAITFGSGWNFGMPAKTVNCSDGTACIDHIGGTATCQNRAICSRCGEEYGKLASCAGGTATCKQKAVCATCNNEYGDYGMHTVSGDVCTACGIVTTVIESNHSPYPNSQDHVMLGTWDYSGAQSVTITITYQTESTSYDWIYLKSGDNYIDLNGNITSTATKIGGTTKTTKTFTTTALTGSVIFRTDGSGNNYYGVSVQVTPNY